MLQDLNRYENLGSPYISQLLLLEINKSNNWKEKDVSDFFYNRKIDGSIIFDGCLPFLLEIGAAIINHDGFLELNFSYKKLVHDFENLKNKIIFDVLQKLTEDSGFLDLISGVNISYDANFRKIIIKNSAFGLRYGSIRNLLLKFEFMSTSQDFPSWVYLINDDWKEIFENIFSIQLRRRKISIEELKEKLKKQERYGEEAEHFVLEYERNRLNNAEGIQWVAPFDVSAGYDILSFNSINSKNNDLYIEVKSYSGKLPRFYWSKNEIKIASLLQNQYAIYLVNRDQIGNFEYQPITIFNPVKFILNDESWEKEVDSYFIKKVD